MRNLKTRYQDFQKIEEKLKERIENFVGQKVYHFRNLVNLYFDYSQLYRQSSFIVEQLVSELQRDSQLLTPFICVQIMQAVSRKGQLRTNKEFQLVDFVSQFIKQNLQEINNDELSIFFQRFAELHYENVGPRYRVHYIVDVLAKHLQ